MFGYKIVVALLLVLTYIPTIEWMWGRWFARDSYYSHGILVPFIIGWLLWRQKEMLKVCSKTGDSIGFYIFLFGIFIHALSAFWRVHFTSGFSIIVVIVGIVLYLFGIEILKKVSFPIFFLVFMIPVPLIVVGELSLKLKLIATAITTKITPFLGITMVNYGNILYFPTGQMVVGDVCSGLRSLISLLAIGALYAYLMKGTIWKKLLLFVFSIPIAIFSNVVRVVILCVIAHEWGVKYTGGIVHDTTGILIYIVAFLLFYTLAGILSRVK